MDAILLSARLILAAVFVVAGLAKLADRDGTAEAVSAFGVPERLGGVVAGGLPAAELAARGLLGFSVTARVGAPVWAAGAAFALALLRQHGQLLLRVDALEQALGGMGGHAGPEIEPAVGLAIGSPAPAFTLPDLRHRRISLDALTGSGTPVLLVFTDP